MNSPKISLKDSGKHSKDKKFKFTKKKVIILAIILAIVAVVVVCLSKKGKNTTENTENQVDVVTRGDIEETISGSAVIEPLERYEIISLVSGDIISAPFEVGDAVNEGDLLYEFDKSSASLGIQKQEIGVEQSKDNYNKALRDQSKLTVRATSAGVVSGLSLKAGDSVNTQTVIAKVEDSNSLEVVLPFSKSQVSSMYVGQSATVSSSAHMSNIAGTVTHIEKNATASNDGSMKYGVTIKITNPGGLTQGITVGGSVGDMVSAGSGTLQALRSVNVNAETAGDVKSVYVSNGDYVKKGDIILTLTSDSVSDSIKSSDLQYKSSALSLQESKDSLDDYSITSPISGTVITKNKKAGDTVDRNSDTQILMVVADISKLKFTLSVDELDISKVEVGQEVKVTCDALEGEEYIGSITKVSVEGTSTNGVTVYDAEVVVDEPGNLRPSMNVDATVVFNSSKDTLMVPVSDVKTIMGKTYVYLQSEEDEKSDNSKKKEKSSKGDFKKPEGMPDDFPKDGEAPKGMEAPEGFTVVEVKTGLANDEYIEILEGVEEGDKIYRVTTTSNSSNNMMGPMGMGGGMSGGPSGGMSGGPNGGMSGGMSGGHPGMSRGGN